MKSICFGVMGLCLVAMACNSGEKGSGAAETDGGSAAKVVEEVKIDTTAPLQQRIETYLAARDSIVWEQNPGKGKSPKVVLYADSNKIVMRRNTGQQYEDYTFTGNFVVNGDVVEAKGMGSHPAMDINNNAVTESWPQELAFSLTADLVKLTFADKSWEELTMYDDILKKYDMGGENLFILKK